LASFFRSSHTRKNNNNLKLKLDRNQTDSHRSKPNSRAVLIDEQSNHLLQLHNKETTNRHRGRKHLRRFER